MAEGAPVSPITALNPDFLFDLFYLVTWDDLDLYCGHKAQEMILMAGETGGPGGTFPRAPSITFPGRDQGEPIYNENGPFLLLLDCFLAIAIIAWVVLGPLRHLGALFLEGPQGLVPSTFNNFSSPDDTYKCQRHYPCRFVGFVWA